MIFVLCIFPPIFGHLSLCLYGQKVEIIEYLGS